MAMDQFLAEYFGNIKTAAANIAPVIDDGEAEKIAQMELFVKAASSQGIDLDAMSEDQITFLWNEVFPKTASEEPKPEEKKEEGKEKESELPFEKKDDDAKKEEAKKEHEEKKEAMAKMAEATYLGKVMAHSLVSELRKIAAANETDKDPGELPPGENKEAAMPPHLAQALGKGKELAGKAGKAVANVAEKAKEQVTDRSKAKSNLAAGAALAGAAGTAATAAALRHNRGKKKESSAIDELALEHAVKMASDAGWDAEQASARIAAVHTLDILGESEKVAAADTADLAVEVRALEFLEAAGYPVTWPEA